MVRNPVVLDRDPRRKPEYRLTKRELMMAQASIAAMANAPGRPRRRPARLRSAMAQLGRVFKSLLDPYRPELHYMRGPGPKWHAKHDSRAG